MSQGAEFHREPSKPHQCRHWNDEGRQCRSWAMHNEFFCYRHRIYPVQPVIENDPFEIAHLADRPAIQQALGDVAARLAANRMDLKRAGLLIYTLQLASNNLAASSRDLAAAHLPPIDAPIIDAPPIEVATEPPTCALQPLKIF